MGTIGECWRQGLCRDLAYLGIALCRSISIPARLVVGCLYGLEPMDLHAWFEAYVSGCWYPFDPAEDTRATGGLPWFTGAMRPMLPYTTSVVRRPFSAARMSG